MLILKSDRLWDFYTVTGNFAIRKSTEFKGNCATCFHENKQTKRNVSHGSQIQKIILTGLSFLTKTDKRENAVKSYRKELPKPSRKQENPLPVSPIEMYSFAGFHWWQKKKADCQKVSNEAKKSN